MVGRGVSQLEDATGAVNRDGVDHMHLDASSEDVSEALGRLRNRSRRNSLPQEVADALARREPTLTAIQPFGEGRHFASSTAFMEEWGEYEHHTLSLYQSRNSVTVTAANAKRERHYRAKGLPVEGDEYEKGVIPANLGHAEITRRCRHGVMKKRRGKGKRNAKTTFYLDCPARITVKSHCDDAGNWSLVTMNEVPLHNHQCTQAMLDSYGTSALLMFPEIAQNVGGMLQAGASARNICDTIGANHGVNITPKQVANLRRDRLGGQAAVTNLKLLLQRYASNAGARCLLVDDQNGQVCAIVMQSAAQREMFNLYGDNLILDWTHNSNNLGFYLGSLMVTSATGRGVSVCDFLCIEQTEAMMTTVLQYFIDMNPGAVDKVISFVIDKDYKEWRVLERLFVKSTVLLCQFHVQKWFAYVVTMRKYQLSLDMRERVVDILSSMVYAKTIEVFDVLASDLAGLLDDVAPSFLAYMHERWYTCRRMWSNCERAAVFTALNTTSNRIESGWNQIKKFLGKKLRIDLCVEAVFAYQTAVMRREHRIFSKYENALILRSDVHRFLRAAMAEVCEYACSKVAKQWESYRLHDDGSGSEYISWKDGEHYLVTRPGPEAATYTVSADVSRCSCDFSTTSALPCRHTIYVARHVMNHTAFPVEAIHRRWRMRNAFSMLPRLSACTAELQTLRTALLLSDSAFSHLIEPNVFEDLAASSTVFHRVAYRRLKRNEHCAVVVFNNLEKRNIVEASLDAVVSYLMEQSTPRFMELAAELDTLVAECLAKWKLQSGTQAEPERPGVHGLTATQVATAVENSSNIDEAVAAVIASEEDGFYDADVSQRGLRCRPPSASKNLRSTNQRTNLDTAEEPYTNVLPHGAELPNLHHGVVQDTVVQVSEQSALQTDFRPATPDSDDFASVLQGIDDYEEPLPTDSSPKIFLPPSPPPSTVSTSDISALLNPVVEEVAQEADNFSIASHDVSSIMRRVAEHQLRTDAPPTRRASSNPSQRILQTKSKQKAPVPVVRATKLDSSWMAEMIGSHYEPPDEASDDGEKRGQEAADSSAQAIITRTLPDRVSRGVTKKQKTSATGARSTYTLQDSECVVELQHFCRALMHTRDVGRVLALCEKYPLRFNEPWIASLNGVAAIQTFRAKDLRVNFRVERSLLVKLKTALATATRPVGPKKGEVVDLTEDDQGSAGSSETGRVVTQAVVMLGSNLRVFSQDNIRDFEMFNNLREKCDSYKADKLWVENRDASQRCDIPYLQQKIAARGFAAGSDAFACTRQSIQAVLESSTLSTMFRIRSARQDLGMTIHVSEIIGFLARRALLNDCVLLYALRQLASDYNDVYVVDSLEPSAFGPQLPIGRTRWVLFPRNFNNVHWCIILVKIAAGAVVEVWLYDPLQGTYESDLLRVWEGSCRLYMAAWVARDGVTATSQPVVRTLRTAPQHDGSSCGVYCIAIALDLISDSSFFVAQECPLPRAIRELRALVMWRILCDSIRLDNNDEEEEARGTVAIIESANSSTTTTLFARKNLGKMAKTRSNWRS